MTMDFQGSGRTPESGTPVEGEYLPGGQPLPGQVQPPPYWSYRPPVTAPGDGYHDQQTEAGRVDVPIERVRRNRGGIAGSLVAAGYFLLKVASAAKFVLIPLAKAPFLISILVNIAVYTWLFGSRNPVYGVTFATGFVALIFVHEMGHLIAARLEGIRATVPFFIPFMGAAIFLRDHPRDARSEAIIGIGGPITGTLGALGVLSLASSLGPSDSLGLLFYRLAFYGFFINLFNMIPLSPLDGGRVLGAVSKWFNVIGLGLLLLGVVNGYLDSPIVLLVLVLGAFGVYRRFTRPEHPGYSQISTGARAAIALGYFALLGVLIAGMTATQQFIY